MRRIGMTALKGACLFLLPLSLAACSPGGGGGAGPAQRLADPAACGADRLGGLIGGPVTLLPGDELSGPVRVIRPGDAVTEDFNPARINIHLDAGDHIARLTCG